MKFIFETKTWAIFSAFMVPILLSISCIGYKYYNWSFEDSTSFAGSYAGTFAAFSGFLFIYVNFKEQQKQFERQSFEAGLYNLIEKLKSESKFIFPSDPKNGQVLQLKDFEKSLINIRQKFLILEPHKLIINKEELSDIIGNSFGVNFNPIRTILELMRAFVAILLFIEIAEIQEKKKYHNLLFSQLSQAETRCFFYGYFYDGFELTLHEKKLIKDFFIQYEGRNLVNRNDILFY